MEDVLDDVFLDRLRVDVLRVLRRHQQAHDLDGNLAIVLVDLVTDCYLRLAVGTKVLQLLRLPDAREAPRDLVREHDRRRHQLGRLAGRVPEHHPLVTGADPVERIVVAGVVLRS